MPRRLPRQRPDMCQDGRRDGARGRGHQVVVPFGVFAQPGGVREDGRGDADIQVLVPGQLPRQRPDVYQDDDGYHGCGGEMPGGVFVRVDGVREAPLPEQGGVVFVSGGQAPPDIFRDEGLCGAAELEADRYLFVPVGIHRCGFVVRQDAHPAGDAGVPVGLLAERGDVLEDDDIDDAVNRPGHIFVFVGTPVGNELRPDHGSNNDD